MANFGDELRSAPAQAKAQADAAQAKRIAEYEAEQRRIVDNAIAYFQGQCRIVAEQGKRSIDCTPDRRAPSGAVYIGDSVTSLMICKKSAQNRARALVPEIEKRLATMGLRSYRVSTVNITTTYPARHYVGFRIQASW